MHLNPHIYTYLLTDENMFHKLIFYVYIIATLYMYLKFCMTDIHLVITIFYHMNSTCI